MEARLKQTYRWNSATFFSGREYIKSEFRFVPPEYEAQAQAQESLEVRQEAVKEPVVETPEIPVVEIPEAVVDAIEEVVDAEPAKRRYRHKLKVEEE